MQSDYIYIEFDMNEQILANGVNHIHISNINLFDNKNG